MRAGKEEGSKWVQVDGIIDKLSVSISGTVWAIMHDKVRNINKMLIFRTSYFLYLPPQFDRSEKCTDIPVQVLGGLNIFVHYN